MKGRIGLKFSVLVYRPSMNRHTKFQIDPAFRSPKMSNSKLTAVDPRSHLIGIARRSLLSGLPSYDYEWKAEFLDARLRLTLDLRMFNECLMNV